MLQSWRSCSNFTIKLRRFIRAESISLSIVTKVSYLKIMIKDIFKIKIISLSTDISAGYIKWINRKLNWFKNLQLFYIKNFYDKYVYTDKRRLFLITFHTIILSLSWMKISLITKDHSLTFPKRLQNIEFSGVIDPISRLADSSSADRSYTNFLANLDFLFFSFSSVFDLLLYVRRLGDAFAIFTCIKRNQDTHIRRGRSATADLGMVIRVKYTRN